MGKTVTIRLDDETYEIIKKAASGQKRSISNFIEYATVAYLADDSFVSDEEMEEILGNETLLNSFSSAEKDIKNKRVRIVE
jgi:predicted transcriptional regulator